MNAWMDKAALAFAGGRVLHPVTARTLPNGHDIPHPIGDPNEDEELPGDDEDEEDDEEEEDDEAP